MSCRVASDCIISPVPQTPSVAPAPEVGASWMMLMRVDELAWHQPLYLRSYAQGFHCRTHKGLAAAMIPLAQKIQVESVHPEPSGQSCLT